MKSKLLIIALMLASGDVYSTNTTRRKLVAKPQRESVDERQDTIVVISGNDNETKKEITIKGFSKTAGSVSETFFVTNNTMSNVTQLRLNIRYVDMENTELHERDIRVNCNVPSMGTRQLKIKSFDQQRQFYYYKGDTPRKSAVPFKVAIKVVGYSVEVAR